MAEANKLFEKLHLNNNPYFTAHSYPYMCGKVYSD